MQGRQAFIGVILFALITILTYFICYEGIGLDEGTSVILALVIGFISEVMYQRLPKFK